MVEHVVSVSANREGKPLVEVERLFQPQVGVEEAGTAERVPGNGSEGGNGRSARELRFRKAWRVYARATAGQGNGANGLTEDGHVLQVCSRALQDSHGGIIQHAKRQTGPVKERSRHSPAARDRVQCPVLELHRKIPDIAGIQAVTHVIVRVAVVQACRAEWVDLIQQAVAEAVLIDAAVRYIVQRVA